VVQYRRATKYIFGNLYIYIAAVIVDREELVISIVYPRERRVQGFDVFGPRVQPRNKLATFLRHIRTQKYPTKAGGIEIRPLSEHQ
jgi:hypothetical protein